MDIKRRIKFNKTENLKIEIGCGKSKRDGWIGVDKGDYGQDIVLDLRDGLPFPDDSCEELFADQVLEHIQLNEDFIFVMNECLRVLKPGGIFTARVPYYSSETAYKDPTHCRYFALHTFTYMTKENEWQYGFDKRWKIKEQKREGDHLTSILIADK